LIFKNLDDFSNSNVIFPKDLYIGVVVNDLASDAREKIDDAKMVM